jgi:hypothetical protein
MNVDSMQQNCLGGIVCFHEIPRYNKIYHFNNFGSIQIWALVSGIDVDLMGIIWE